MGPRDQPALTASGPRACRPVALAGRFAPARRHLAPIATAAAVHQRSAPLSVTLS